MKLNPDCVRDILLWIEEKSEFAKIISFPEEAPDTLTEKYTLEELRYHLDQCRQSGLIRTERGDLGGGLAIWDLTPNGHTFIANIRESNNWSSVKKVAKKVGSVSLDSITQIAGQVIAALIQKQF